MQLAMQEKDTDAARTAKYEDCIQSCAEHLGEVPSSSTAEGPAVQDAQHRPYLFEGQMSSVQHFSFSLKSLKCNVVGLILHLVPCCERRTMKLRQSFCIIGRC